MAEIAAAAVMKLRKMSGQGMMDCKKALGETGGDIDKALEILRKKGLATMAKRADRETSEGKIVSVIGDDGKVGIMAALCCETDFVAKSDDFLAAAEKLPAYMQACESDEGADNLAKTQVNGKAFSEVITETVSKTGEKMEVGEFVRFRVQGSGIVGCYVHFNNKIGAMVEIAADSDKVAQGLGTLPADICMHITAINPAATDRTQVDPDLVERERAAAAEQVKNKPANIIDKIVEGKLNKFFQEICLVDQTFVKDDSKTVGQALQVAAKAAGGEACIKRFVRIEIG